MKRLFDPLFSIYCLLWCLIHLLRWVKHPLPWLNDYLTDFLFVPVVAHISLFFVRSFVVQNKMFIYPIIYPLFIALYSAVVFEGIMPGISTSYTRDYGDVLAYFLGGIFYYYVHQRIISFQS